MREEAIILEKVNLINNFSLRIFSMLRKDSDVRVFEIHIIFSNLQFIDFFIFLNLIWHKTINFQAFSRVSEILWL